jgi:predicted DsbA family dithiol-disulfide isomerase
MTVMTELRVDVWSDIACPWCYVGKRRLEAALRRVPFRDSVHVTWRAFELDPSAPAVQKAVPYAQRLARKYGSSVPEAQAKLDQMTEMAARDGLELRFDRVRQTSTFDAHRLIHLGGERGVQDAVKERLLRAYFTEGEPLGDREALVRLAGEAGLDANEARAVLAGDAYSDAVIADEREARELGIRGVPFFFLAGKYGVSGAQPAELLATALTQAWDELAPAASAAAADGAVCGPEGCA